MKRKMLAPMNAVCAFMVVGLSSLLLVGCASILLPTDYVGSVIKTGYQIPIDTGENSGVYQTNDLTIDYHYLKSDGHLKIWGYVRFDSSIEMNFNAVDYFNLGVLFANSEGTILSNTGLTSANWVNLTLPNQQVQFMSNLALPKNTSLMAFTYTGQASMGGGGGTGGGSTQFWQYPIVK